MVKVGAVIFDWGGVLIENPAPGLMRYCTDALGVSVERYVAAHRNFQDEFQKGLIAEEVFWARVCSELSCPGPAAKSLWGDAFRTVYQPRAEMFEMVRRLKQKGYRTGFLSNTEVPAMKYFHTLGYDMFDVIVFSCAEHTRKPERKIYELATGKIGMTPTHSVFIDDSPVYIEGAQKAGLNTILFSSVAEVRDRLAEFGVAVD